MTFALEIQNFLKQKLNEDNLTRLELSNKINIPYNSIGRLTRASKVSPELKNIIKIADYFDCSIDEIVGRKSYIVLTKYIRNIPSSEIRLNLKNFIKNKLQTHSLTIYKLAKDCNFSEDVIPRFMKEEGQKTLGSSIIISLANYFEVSIDEMIGRVPPSNSESK